MSALPPDDSEAWKVWVGSVVSVVLATIAVIARLVARRISAANFWWDDYTIIAALVSTHDHHAMSVQSQETYLLIRLSNGAWASLDGSLFALTIMDIILSTWDQPGSKNSKRYAYRSL